MCIAAIDIGTNSVRLLVVKEESGKLVPVYRELITTRLGSGLQKSGVLSDSGKTSTRVALSSYVKTARQQRAEKIVIIATSAMREASDGKKFASMLAATTNCKVDIISPEKEAYFSYLGVTKTLAGMEQALIFDLGGGSCELIWCQHKAIHSSSYMLGALYLTDIFFQHDPPLQREINAARNYIRQYMKGATALARQIVGVGGTVTTLAAMALNMSEYDPQLIHGFSLTRERVTGQLATILALATPERAKLTGIQKERAFILPAGALVVDELLSATELPSLTVSEGDILMGCLYDTISSASI
ncbi:MAG: Ppx/GppA family phosphatase [Firmicutes bacterium]|nr:Ppx/GppA family phosphatase [Bacillota bacterium]